MVSPSVPTFSERVVNTACIGCPKASFTRRPTSPLDNVYVVACKRWGAGQLKRIDGDLVFEKETNDTCPVCEDENDLL